MLAEQIQVVYEGTARSREVHVFMPNCKSAGCDVDASGLLA